MKWIRVLTYVDVNGVREELICDTRVQNVVAVPESELREAKDPAVRGADGACVIFYETVGAREPKIVNIFVLHPIDEVHEKLSRERHLSLLQPN